MTRADQNLRVGAHWPSRDGSVSARAIKRQDLPSSRGHFGGDERDGDAFGMLEKDTPAIFGRSYAAEPDKLIEQLKQDEAIAEADTLLFTVPNQLGVAYNVHVLEALLHHVAPAMGRR